MVELVEGNKNYQQLLNKLFLSRTKTNYFIILTILKDFCGYCSEILAFSIPESLGTVPFTVVT